MSRKKGIKYSFSFAFYYEAIFEYNDSNLKQQTIDVEYQNED